MINTRIVKDGNFGPKPKILSRHSMCNKNACHLDCATASQTACGNATTGGAGSACGGRSRRSCVTAIPSGCAWTAVASEPRVRRRGLKKSGWEWLSGVRGVGSWLRQIHHDSPHGPQLPFGHPVVIELIPAQASDSPQLPGLMAGLKTQAVLADKGYDSESNRAAICRQWAVSQPNR
jgi:hypothetical protein